MLIKFTVGNFLSFRDQSSLDMTAEALKEKKGNLHTPYLYNSKLQLLKSVAIYGYNSHGKTNFIRAYAFFRNIILTSFALGKVDSEIDVEPFLLNTSNLDKPSFFELTFLIKETKYRYGFEITNKKVVSEWFYYAEAGVRENKLFYRYEQEFRDISKLWNKESGSRIEQAKVFTKPHNLFLSVLLTQDNIPRVEEIASWLKGNIILTNYYSSDLNGADKIYSKLEYRETIRKFIENADLGFTNIFDKISTTINKGLHQDLTNIWYENEKNNFDLYVNHNIYNENYEFQKKVEFELSKKESSGSIKYFILTCFIAYAIKNAQLIWIDELDASLHTSLFSLIIKQFNDSKYNSSGSQMIFTTHNTVMLNRQLRRDQIMFVTKNKYGESFLKPMHSPDKPIRIGKSVESEYRDGDLGGVSEKVIESLKNTLFDDQNF